MSDFLLNEDLALRKKLQGIIVHDQKADGTVTPRPVGVFFGQPDQELRSQSYPYITIDMIDIQRDTAREMRGTTDAAYLQPIDFGVDGANEFEMDLPIPVNIDYQITVYSRHPRHDRSILAQLLTSRLVRFGVLEIEEKSETAGDIQTVHTTVRRMDLINVAKRDNNSEQAKRLFVNAISVRVSSEIVQSAYRAMYKVLEIHVDMPSEANAALGWDGLGEFVID